MNILPFLRGCGIMVTAAGLLVSPSRAGLSEATDFDGPWSTAGIGSGPSTGVYWVEQSETTLDGTDAVEGRLGGFDAVQTWIETEMTGPGTVYFSYLVRDEPSSGWDCMLDVLAGAQQTVLYIKHPFSLIEPRWREASVTLAAGSQTVRWQLASSRGRSTARVFVDQVWPSSDPRPRITANPDQSLNLGTPFSMSVPITSATAATLTAEGLPPGLSVVPDTNEIQGTPTATGTYLARLTAANAAGRHTTEVTFIVEGSIISLSDALDDPNLVFTQPDDATNWTGITGQGHDGIDSARAAVGTMQTFSPLLMSTTVTGPGSLSFWYRCDERGLLQPDGTQLFLYLGPVSIDQPRAQFGGAGWAQYSLNIPPGPQLVTWGAFRGASSQETAPILYAFLDEVVFTPTTVPPQSTFPAWTTAWNVGDQPISSDTDGDGLDFLMEYATGGSPYTPNPELLPTASIVDGYFTLRFTKAPSPTDLIYFAQGTRSLLPNSWTTSLVEVIDEDNTMLLARSKKPVSQEPILHLRVLVLTTP